MFKPIAGTTQTLCLIAHPVAGSSSPALHNASFEEQGLDARFMAYDVLPEHLASAVAGLAALGVRGYSVGVPHKEAVIPLLDELSDAARLMQSVNCVQMTDEGRLVGHNTDGLGFTEALEAAGIHLQGAKLAIVDDGAEGPSWIVQAALEGASEILVLCAKERLGQERTWLDRIAAQLTCHLRLMPLEELIGPEALMGYDAFCNGSRIGTGETLGSSPVPKQCLNSHLVVVDANYNPRVTTLLAEAAQAGCVTIGGLEPLLNQAAYAQKLWLDVDMPKKDVKERLFG